MIAAACRPSWDCAPHRIRLTGSPATSFLSIPGKSCSRSVRHLTTPFEKPTALQSGNHAGLPSGHKGIVDEVVGLFEIAAAAGIRVEIGLNVGDVGQGSVAT